MIRRSRPLALVLAASILAGLVLPPPAAAIVPVTDYAHIVLNHYWHIAHYVQFAEQIYQQYLQIVNQYDQIKYQLQALKKLENPNWRDVSGLLFTCDWLMKQATALAYSLDGLNDQYLQTFPGWTQWTSWPDQARLQATRSIDTMRTGLTVVQEQFRHDIADQIHLMGIEARVNDIHGTQEALETSAVLQSWSAQELSLVKQQLAVANNLHAVYYGWTINREAQAEANYRALLSTVTTSAAPPRQTWTGDPTWWPFG
jgi:P-type conjugative transfer protein TrbJ